MTSAGEELLLRLAIGKPVAERGAFLDAVCGKDAVLRQRLEARLGAQMQPAMQPTAEAEAAWTTITVDPAQLQFEAVGQRLGRYKLLEKIGEGGCGTVYVAEQTEPVRRRVALKVIKLGMDTREVIARFDAERQALAMMDHPHIAKVLDAGATETGRPYFVMELVRGIPLTGYCDQASLGTPERIDLFIKVCNAIQHAHQKGIIHRDIKPSNILVTVNDGVPMPKVIDFGIAKAIEGRLTDATVYTQLHQFLGTPAYMSPEQAEMTSLDIDTRSDIYSLGVLLYELLAGSTPFDARELLASGIEAMRRTIREQEPLRPSTKLAAMKGDELSTTAKRRATEPPRLLHQLQGDLDWIVMKCLEKDRTRRYATADGLGADLRRHLDDKPVSARAPSASYRFRKFARRNRVALGVAAAISVLFLALVGSMTMLAKEFRAGRYGGIKIHSNPEGAEVWHAGERVGMTPYERTGLPIGEFAYSLVLSDYETVTNRTPLAPKKLMNDFTFLRRVGQAVTGTVASGNTNLTRMTAAASQGLRILEVQGRVKMARKGSAQYTTVHPNMVLSVGDSLSTGARSRTTLLWPDGSVMRVDELTDLEINPPGTNRMGNPALNILEGTVYRLNGDGTSNSFRIRTPVASGAIRG